MWATYVFLSSSEQSWLFVIILFVYHTRTDCWRERKLTFILLLRRTGAAVAGAWLLPCQHSAMNKENHAAAAMTRTVAVIKYYFHVKFLSALKLSELAGSEGKKVISRPTKDCPPDISFTAKYCQGLKLSCQLHLQGIRTPPPTHRRS